MVGPLSPCALAAGKRFRAPGVLVDPSGTACSGIQRKSEPGSLAARRRVPLLALTGSRAARVATTRRRARVAPPSTGSRGLDERLVASLQGSSTRRKRLVRLSRLPQHDEQSDRRPQDQAADQQRVRAPARCRARADGVTMWPKRPRSRRRRTPATCAGASAAQGSVSTARPTCTRTKPCLSRCGSRSPSASPLDGARSS